MIPKQAAGWNRVQYTNFTDLEQNHPNITATYTNPDFSYEIKLDHSYIEANRRKLLQLLKALPEQFGEDAVQILKQEDNTVYIIKIHMDNEEYVAVGVISGAMTTKLEIKEPIEVTDIDATVAELQAIYDTFDLKQLAKYYTVPVADASGVDAPDGFVPYAVFLGNDKLAFAYPEDWSVVDFLNQWSNNRSSVVIIKDLEAVKAHTEFLDNQTLIKNFIADISNSDNVLISIDRSGKSFKSKGYTAEAIKGIKKTFPTTFSNLIVQQPPTKTTIDGHEAFESVIHGETINGQSVVMQRHIIRIPDKAVYLVDIIRPMEASKHA